MCLAEKNKEQIRRELRLLRREFSCAAAVPASAGISMHLQSIPAFQHAKTLAGYLATPGEACLVSLLQNLLAAGTTTVLLPRYCPSRKAYELVAVANLENDIVTGAFNIREPRPELPALARNQVCAEDVVWLVPGLAFDRQGHRLGRGGGYYDRLLDGAAGLKIGIAFDWQLRPTPLPVAAHDIGMNLLVTESGVITTK